MARAYCYNVATRIVDYISEITLVSCVRAGELSQPGRFTMTCQQDQVINIKAAFAAQSDVTCRNMTSSVMSSSQLGCQFMKRKFTAEFARKCQGQITCSPLIEIPTTDQMKEISCFDAAKSTHLYVIYQCHPGMCAFGTLTNYNIMTTTEQYLC